MDQIKPLAAEMTVQDPQGTEILARRYFSFERDGQQSRGKSELAEKRPIPGIDRHGNVVSRFCHRDVPFEEGGNRHFAGNNVANAQPFVPRSTVGVHVPGTTIPSPGGSL